MSDDRPFVIVAPAPTQELSRVLEFREKVPECAQEAAFCLMFAIDARGGNPAWPHGGDPLLNALWHFARLSAGIADR